MSVAQHDRKKDEIVDTVAAMLAERLAASQAQAAVSFARSYYAGVGPEDLLQTPVEDLYGAVLSHWNLARQRKLGEPNIRVYNPGYEEHGWQSTHTVVEVVTDDMPFLVDSISMEMTRHGLTVHLIIHPVVKVRRNRKGTLTKVVPADVEGADLVREAVMRFEVDRQNEADDLHILRSDVERVMEDVRATVDDWQPMRQRMQEVIATIESAPPPVPEDDLGEALDFLRWAVDGHFTYIGCRTYDLLEIDGEDILRLVPDSGLGVLRESAREHVSESFSHVAPHLRALARSKTLLIITKSTARSTVHRPAHLDYIGVKRFDETGEVIGEWRFLGLYSSLAYSTRPAEIPLLRRKVSQVIEGSGYSADSHAGKAMQNILDHFPRDEMFQASVEELQRITIGILQVQERHRLRLFTRRDIYGRFVTALVYVPRDRYNTQLRVRLQKILIKAMDAQSSEFNVQFSESVLARVQFIIRTNPDQQLDYDETDLEARMAEAMLSWEDRLSTALRDRLGEADGNRLGSHYVSAFPVAYQHDFPSRTAAMDIIRLQQIKPEQPLATHLYRPLEGPEDLLRFKVYGRRKHMALSDVLPMLERMGLRVLEARPYAVKPANETECWILDFDMCPAQPGDVDVLEVKDIFQEAFVRVCAGDVDNDGFNRLVLGAQLGWRDVVVLRAVCKYLLQTGITFSQAYMEQSLAGNPHISTLLVELFHARFDPQRRGTSEQAVEQIRERILQALDTVANLDEDRILRRFLATIMAILRTNYYQLGPDRNHHDYLSFKLDPHKVPELPEPKPMFEVFVYSPRIEGVHLRGGMVARGGLRWSDRMEDYRTEILGLMKAQTVKNAVIVPVGAKGGFVTKRLPAGDDRDAIQKEVIACYRIFIRGLLDLTDNLSAGRVKPPQRVVRYDTDDPYLVVAADKGTATFSDIANGLSQEYGFWLGDAFASGGSAGYDHKQMGITARGAWASVMRHFRELGVDTQATPFTVAAIGDMSGDVFGNGMLLSEHIRLQAAFNHQHIFIDPDPDPATSFQERKRLFELPRSSWKDYDRKLISRGGSIYPRSAKSIKLSQEARRTLGIEAEHLTPTEVVQAILCAPVDLLWNGGIGTYVKATSEHNRDAGDRTNDALRVNGSDLRCRVVGEGGNLGFTQLGRVEFARAGGRINTDAIDNSAGVDCSDHEVNIKILLDTVVRNGDMTGKQRNKLLADMTDEVAGLVLRHNYLQTQALSIAGHQNAALLGDQVRLIRELEREGRLNRALEFLPDDNALEELESGGNGLTPPENSVLLAYAKIRLFDQLMDSDIAKDPYLTRELQDYFPVPLRERFAQLMEQHPLRGEIVVTHITDNIVNRMGSTFCQRLQESTGASPADVARAYTAAREVFRIGILWRDIEALDNKVAAEVQLDMLADTIRLADRATVWLLRNRRAPLSVSEAVEQLAPGVAVLSERMPKLLIDAARELLQQRTQALRESGVPAKLASQVAAVDPLYSALDIAEVASGTDLEILQIAEAYFDLAIRLELPWLLGRIRELPRTTHWQQKARTVLRDELFAEQRRLTAGLFAGSQKAGGSKQRVSQWLATNDGAVSHYRRMLSDLQSARKHDLAMLSVAVREVHNLADDH